MDDAVDLERTADVLRSVTPDLVGLQEVDLGVERSGSVDQATELGRLLDMTPVFGAFMEYQGGEYGMAILSGLSLARSWEIALPEGQEPRIALAAEVVLPEGDTIVAVNVHFDWIEDDGDRFRQASALTRVLDALPYPWILLGDFNDEPGSRTLALLQERATEAAKAEGRRFTFSTDDPRKEIDFVFAAPAARWNVLEARVVDERAASDHFPVLAEVVLTPSVATARLPHEPSDELDLRTAARLLGDARSLSPTGDVAPGGPPPPAPSRTTSSRTPGRGCVPRSARARPTDLRRS
jgi:endonuclease/exonuclease/phosphatase family metal-dependent hydrolase